MKIVIAGAGIGGLVSALSLHAAGHRDIEIYERVSQIRPLGVGINLLPHAVRELTELGLGEQVAAIGVATRELSYFNRFGQLIWSEPRGIAAGYRWPQISLHRGELQMLLLDAVIDRLGTDAVRLGHSLLGVEHGTDADTDTARFARDGGEELAVEAGLIVGADGIHSALRRQHYPNEGEPIWNGLTLWRGTASAPGYLGGRTMIMAGDGQQKFVAYPLSEGEQGAEARINFIAERRAPEGAVATADWNRAVDPAPILELFADWDFDWLDVPKLIAASEEILEYPMVDRDPLPQWSFGHSTLVGDAAHAMYPIGSNGASQAILDARTLAHELATRPSVAEALSAYEEVRRPATAGLIESNRKLGPERVMQMAFERAPEGFAHINDVLSQEELEAVAAEYKRAAGFHPDLLNLRPSLSAPGADVS
ncbi:flavin-dependent oxidoreductase [Microterricola viridarii]|uniref:FAD-binding domain-containing protein n=1 Tax=Microterricola viridarii TaxID=412690 RepID=A0A0Y0P6J4_9MICO|nr:flavin-dependent oxidoreductase [Microterricola viridarii]AMB59799.1 hypothetical protein AWU67_14070 [Microterricola viridarii]